MVVAAKYSTAIESNLKIANLDNPTPLTASVTDIERRRNWAIRKIPPVVVNEKEQLIAEKPELSIAQAVTTPAQPTAATPAPTSVNELDQINRYSNEGKANNSIAQVTSVSQLSDVQPTDWAFQALQSLSRALQLYCWLSRWHVSGKPSDDTLRVCRWS